MPKNYQQNQHSTIHSTHNLQNLSTEQLKSMLRQLQTQHDIIQAKNQQLATHISDLRAVIQKVQKQKDQQLDYTVAKKKKMQDQVDRYVAALKVVHSSSNTMFSDMMAFKELNGNN